MEKQRNYDFRYFHLMRQELDHYELSGVEILRRKDKFATLSKNENTFIWTSSTFNTLKLVKRSKLTFLFYYKRRDITDIEYQSALQTAKPSKEILISFYYQRKDEQACFKIQIKQRV
jgi:hypothetical protein